MFLNFRNLFLCTFLLGVVGCGGGTDVPSESPAVAPPESGIQEADASEDTVESPAPTETESTDSTPEQSATGTFHGVVTFNGEIPEPQVIQATKDAEYCSAGEGPVHDVIVTDGKLAGAVIEITIRGKDLPDFKTPEDGFVIRQKDCRFVPRLLVAYSGAELTVHNDDKVGHNVNTGEWNLLQAPGADPIREKINYGGNPFTRVTCNIHNWMETWVYVARSPFYAASDEKGEFRIEGLPTGKKIRGTITHATLGKQRFLIDVEPGGTTEKDFEFESK